MSQDAMAPSWIATQIRGAGRMTGRILVLLACLEQADHLLRIRTMPWWAGVPCALLVAHCVYSAFLFRED